MGNEKENKKEIVFEEISVYKADMDSLEDAFAPATGFFCAGCKQRTGFNGIFCG